MPLPVYFFPPNGVQKLVSLGKSITDFSAEGADDKEGKDKEGLEEDNNHEKLDEEMGKSGQLMRCFYAPFLQPFSDALIHSFIQSNSCLVSENGTCSVPAFCRDARVYDHTTTAMHDIEYIPTPPTLNPPRAPPSTLGVAVVFDDDEEKDDDSEVDEVQSGEEDDEDEDLGTEARKGRSLRGEEGEEEGEEEDVDELSVQDVDAYWLQRCVACRLVIADC